MGFLIILDWFVLLYINVFVIIDDGLFVSCILGNYLIYNYINIYKVFNIVIFLFMLLRFFYSNIFCCLISFIIVYNMYYMMLLDVRVVYGE